MGKGAGDSITTGAGHVLIGEATGTSITTNNHNTFVGRNVGTSTTGGQNTFVGCSNGSTGSTGHYITTGTKNTIIGAYSGNQNGLDIRTSSNNIVLSDGDGNPRVVTTNNGYTQMSPNISTATRYGSTSHIMHSNSGDITAFLENSNASPYGMLMDFSGASPDNNGNYFLVGSDSTTNRFFIFSDGDVQNHDNSYGAISDVKLKEQITDASSQWDDIKALTIRKYKMKTDVATGDSDAHWRLGVVAQEVEEAGMGGLVKDNPDLDRNNNDLGTTTKSVKYSILYMKAVKALQEAMERIETLEAKVTALEGE